MASGGSELMTEWVVVGRLSHESRNALENMYWGHMTQDVTHITVLSICQHHYGYIMSCTLSSSLLQPWWRNCTAWILAGRSFWRPVSQESELPRSVWSQTDIFLPPFLFVYDNQSFLRIHSRIRPHPLVCCLHSFMCLSRPGVGNVGPGVPLSCRV